MEVQLRPQEKPLTVLLQAETLEWLATRAKANSRAKCREASTIIEAERSREARRLFGGVLNAEGGAR